MIVLHLHLQTSLTLRDVHWAWSNRASSLEAICLADASPSYQYRYRYQRLL